MNGNRFREAEDVAYWAMINKPIPQEREARLAMLDAALARGIADANAQRVRTISSAFDRLEAKYQAQAKAEDDR
jgi:hypothetical protein